MRYTFQPWHDGHTPARVRLRGALWPLMVALLWMTACGGEDLQSPMRASATPELSRSASPVEMPSTVAVPSVPPSVQAARVSPTPLLTPSPSPAPIETATPTPPVTPRVTPSAGPADQPLGFPIDPRVRTGIVIGERGVRQIAWEMGSDAATFSRDDQPSADPERANQAGWNCRTHVAYEGRPAVDWYIPPGTPVYATMDGTATLIVITTSNAFDYYSVSREPYLGNPDRGRAPLSPFPGPGGGKGVFVRVENSRFVTEYAHLDVELTTKMVSAKAFLSGFGPGTDFLAGFARMRDFTSETPVARWQVQRGELLGYSGDSGYSEAPHLHYAVYRTGAPLLCPTGEAGFADGGWLFR